MTSPARLALIFCCLGAKIACAQPPDAPSTIKSPVNTPLNAPHVWPEPPPITVEELQNLNGGPTLLNFDGRELDVNEVLKPLVSASGGAPSNNPPIRGYPKTNIDWNQTPFWDAMHDVETRFAVRWDLRSAAGSQEALVPVKPGGAARPGELPELEGRIAAQNSFVRVVANAFSRTTLRFARLGETDTPLQTRPSRASLAISAYFDPKLQVFAISSQKIQWFLAGDVPALDGGLISIPTRTSVGGNFIVARQLLALPAAIAPGTRLFRLTGVLHTIIGAPADRWEVPDLGAIQQSEHVVGPVRYRVESVALTKEKLSVRLSAPRFADLPQKYNIFKPFDSVRARDAAGFLLPLINCSFRYEDRSYAEFNFAVLDSRNQPIPGPYSLVWTIPTELRSLDVPFELRDVIVP